MPNSQPEPLAMAGVAGEFDKSLETGGNNEAVDCISPEVSTNPRHSELIKGETSMGILATIIVGLIAGFLAHLLMRTQTGLILDLVMGVIGGFVGGWLSSLLFGTNFMSGVNLTSILTALVGAIIVIALYRLVSRGRM
jgi:uncharacterized membrane protein YeaQ/YmgE (transglycosylase-associated protein family)